MRMTCSPDSEQYDQADLRELAVDGLKIAAPALAEMRSAGRSLQQEGPYALNTKLEVVIKRVPSARLEDPYALEEHGWRESLDTLRSLKDCKAKDQILEWMGKYAGLLSQSYNIDNIYTYIHRYKIRFRSCSTCPFLAYRLCCTKQTLFSSEGSEGLA